MSAPSDPVLVVGAGAAALVIDLVAGGYSEVTALDIAPAALDQLGRELGADAERVERIVADVRSVNLADRVAVWHDRAVFHFLTNTHDQAAYAERAAATVRCDGALLVATFAPNGPEQCSGLPVARHDAASLSRVFTSFELVESFEHEHRTPWGSSQMFTHTWFRRACTDGRGR